MPKEEGRSAPHLLPSTFYLPYSALAASFVVKINRRHFNLNRSHQKKPAELSFSTAGF
jgi:hypothetical protein